MCAIPFLRVIRYANLSTFFFHRVVEKPGFCFSNLWKCKSNRFLFYWKISRKFMIDILLSSFFLYKVLIFFERSIQKKHKSYT